MTMSRPCTGPTANGSGARSMRSRGCRDRQRRSGRGVRPGLESGPGGPRSRCLDLASCLPDLRGRVEGSRSARRVAGGLGGAHGHVWRSGPPGRPATTPRHPGSSGLACLERDVTSETTSTARLGTLAPLDEEKHPPARRAVGYTADVERRASHTPSIDRLRPWRNARSAPFDPLQFLRS